MAGERAIGSAAEAVRSLLERSWRGQRPSPRFELCTPAEFAAPQGTAVSVLVYRVAVDQTASAGGPAFGGRLDVPSLTLEVNLLVSVSAPSAQEELDLLGWVATTLHQTPMLTPADGVFAPGERLAVAADPLTREEVLGLWQSLGVPRLALAYRTSVRLD